MLVPQTTAAALVSENKALSFPMSVDSIPTCEDQEDHVAMSTAAAWRFAEVVANSERVVAIELICAARALRFRLNEGTVRLGAGSSAVLERLEAAATSEAPGEQVEAVTALLREGVFA
jgi:histidine ammonia-lyase